MKKRTIAAVTSLILASCSMRDDIGPDTTEQNKEKPYTGDTTTVIDTIADGDSLILDTIYLDTNGNEIVIDTSGSQDKGFTIVSERTETIHLSGGVSVISAAGEDTVALKDIRNEIDKENMSLPLFAVTDLTIKGVSSNSTVANTLKDTPVVLKVYTMLPGQEPALSIETPEEGDFFDPITFGQLHNGVSLNKGLYTVDSTSLTAFENKVKDESQSQIIFRVEITFTQEVTLPEEFSLEFTIEGSSKKKL